MHQLVFDITRRNSNDPEKGTCIDLVLQTTFLQFHICLLPITSASVIIILCLLKSLLLSQPIVFQLLDMISDFTKADWSAINYHLFCIDWQTAFAECPDVPAQFDLWNDKLTEIIRLFILVKTHYNNSRDGVNKYPLHIRKLLSKSAPPGEYINYLNPLLRMLGIKLLQLAIEKLYIHLNVTENWPWSTCVTPVPFIDTQILNVNLKLVSLLSLLHLVMLLQILLLKLSYLTNIFPLFFKLIITSSHLALSNFLYYQSTQFLQLKKLKLAGASWTQS